MRFGTEDRHTSPSPLLGVRALRARCFTLQDLQAGRRGRSRSVSWRVREDPTGRPEALPGVLPAGTYLGVPREFSGCARATGVLRVSGSAGEFALRGPPDATDDSRRRARGPRTVAPSAGRCEKLRAGCNVRWDIKRDTGRTGNPAD